MLKVMLVDDYLRFRLLVRDWFLNEFPSMEIIEAEDGQEALRKLTPSPPDLIFMDIGLPGENGIEITRRIKTDYPDVTVIILTGADLQEYWEGIFQCGANGLISKTNLKWEEISTVVKCHQEAKRHGRKLVCVRFLSGEFSI
jgi:CheY-like chemotaxis protein